MFHVFDTGCGCCLASCMVRLLLAFVVHNHGPDYTLPTTHYCNYSLHSCPSSKLVCSHCHMLPLHNAHMMITITGGILLHTYITVTFAQFMDLVVHIFCKLSSSRVWYELHGWLRLWLQLLLGRRMCFLNMCMIVYESSDSVQCHEDKDNDFCSLGLHRPRHPSNWNLCGIHCMACLLLLERFDGCQVSQPT